jgi:hypothetical protein
LAKAGVGGYIYLLEKTDLQPFQIVVQVILFFCVFLQVSEDFWNHFHSDLTATPEDSLEHSESSQTHPLRRYPRVEQPDRKSEPFGVHVGRDSILAAQSSQVPSIVFQDLSGTLFTNGVFYVLTAEVMRNGHAPLPHCP